jgi:hypothetical protein
LFINVEREGRNEKEKVWDFFVLKTSMDRNLKYLAELTIVTFFREIKKKVAGFLASSFLSFNFRLSWTNGYGNQPAPSQHSNSAKAKESRILLSALERTGTWIKIYSGQWRKVAWKLSNKTIGTSRTLKKQHDLVFKINHISIKQLLMSYHLAQDLHQQTGAHSPHPALETTIPGLLIPSSIVS